MRPRPGFSLVELLVVAVLAGIVLAAAYQTLVVQERVQRQERAVIRTQESARIAMAVISAELRETSASGGDLVMADRDSIRFRALRRVGLICGFNNSERWADVVALGTDGPHSSGFAAEDSILIFHDGDAARATDDTWGATRVNTNPGSGATCPFWPGAPTSRLKVDALNTAARVGAPIRSFTHVRYRLAPRPNREYALVRREGNDGVERELLGGMAPPTDGGLRFRYFDADGNELTATPLNQAARENVALVDIVVRARTTRETSGVDTYTDSLVTRIALRGNAPVVAP